MVCVEITEYDPHSLISVMLQDKKTAAGPTDRKQQGGHLCLSVSGGQAAMGTTGVRNVEFSLGCIAMVTQACHSAVKDGP